MTSTSHSPGFRPPSVTIRPGDARHHEDAAAGNHAATTAALGVLDATLDGSADCERILLRAAAGAGKSHALKRMVGHALGHRKVRRVGVTAFTNKQVWPLAEALGKQLGKHRVCLFAARDRVDDIPEPARQAATVVCETYDVPDEAAVILATTHKFGSRAGRNLYGLLGPAHDGEHLFDVLFVDEAWQLAHHRYAAISWLAPVHVGVGDVGQLPPLDPGQNPWRGDRTYNPYRAWPTAYEHDPRTWSVDLPAVWRPTAPQLPLWRAFYRDWDVLDCVAAPGDRSIELGPLDGDAAAVWGQVATGVPTLVEVDGLEDPDAPDVGLPLLGVVERWLDALLGAGFALRQWRYHDDGRPKREVRVDHRELRDHPLIAVLATRNQAVDDAQDVVDRLTERHGLPPGLVQASTVDSWQGQTNAITVAVHPLSGASALDDFNSAFGRLAVTCTRDTHGLLLVSRTGLDDLLAAAPARPGTPLGEPGTRQLPRQTHARILETFARGTVEVGHRASAATGA